jgi:hypothetical protein
VALVDDKDLERAAGELLYARVWNVQMPQGRHA